MLFVISGPSGVGKTTLVRRVLEDFENIVFCVSHTTRKKRNGEVEGRDYYFVSESEFRRMIEEDELVEWAIVHGSYYGTSKKELKKVGVNADCILDIDIQGAQQIREKLQDATFIFIMPPLFQELKKRLEARGDESAASVQKRLEVAREEIKYYHQFDYIVINDELKRAVKDLKSIIRSEKCRLDTRSLEVESILESFTEY
ncbi:MAG: guanylate kinase [Candidatus Aminicenantaceae bacterium]